MPSMPGIIRSESSRSNGSACRAASASAPDVTPTTCEALLAERVAQGVHQLDLVVDDEQPAGMCFVHGILRSFTNHATGPR